MMLSIAKDSLKKSQNFYLYKKSFSRVSSISESFTQRIKRVQNRGLSSENANNQLNQSIHKSESTERSEARHKTNKSAQRVSSSKEVDESRIDMLVNNFVRTRLVDKHGTLLPQTMRHLNSINLQAFHSSAFENYSKLSDSLLNTSRKLDRNKLLEPSTPLKEFSAGNPWRFMFMESVASPFTIQSSAFHTSARSSVSIRTPSRASIDGKMGGPSQNQKSLVENDVEDHSESHRGELDFTVQHSKSDDRPKRSFVDYEFGFGKNYSQNEADFLEESNSSHTKIASVGRRHSKRANPTLNPDPNKERDNSTPETEAYSQEKMEKLFPDPRSTLNRLYSIVSAELKDAKYKPEISYEAVKAPSTRQGATNKKSQHWECTYGILWPSKMSFSATAKGKAVAANNAALKCLHYLQVTGKMKNGLPMLYDSDEIKDILSKPSRIEVDPKTLRIVEKLLDWYRTDIAELLETSRSTEMSETGSTEIEIMDSREEMYEGGEEETSGSMRELTLPSNSISDPLRGTPFVEHSSAALNRRDMDMYHRLKERQMNNHNNLPITDYREDIISQLENERVLLVKGEPGCGKSTQLPQFILDHFTQQGKGTDCNIIITQPRRISAISLAERVAHERKERLGESVGYQVRLQSVLPQGPSGGVLFCSTGILLRRLQNNPSLLGCSHVILDEAHERDLNTDILIVLLNRALQKNPDLKLVIMSATINAGLFEKYFNCSTINVPGFTYPVKMHFLEDMLNLGIKGVTSQDMSLPNPAPNSEQMARVVQWISKTKPAGAILCFLPGWSEIQKLKRELEEVLNQKNHVILPVHSRLPHSDQALIFNRAPEGVRKVILATNIAETSITINDVVYVVDSCAHKEIRLQHDTGLSSIDNQWVSQGNINQRKGRAGRVQAGESFHFITREKFKSLDQFPTPEIMRAELQKAVLDCKTYTSEKAAEFFAQMPEPPRITAVQQAVNELIEIGALNQNEDLTALGKRIALFPIDPRLSKAMVYSTIFQCVNPIVTLTSILSSEFEIFTDRLFDKSPIRRLKQQFDPASDHLALAWLFEQWNAYNDRDQRKAQQFTRQAQLQFGRMITLKDLRNLYAQHLTQSRMMDSYERWENLDSRMNKYATNDELVRGVLLAGLDRVLQRKDGEFKNGRFKKVKNVMSMQDGHRATLTPDSVNYNREKWPSSYLTYQRHVHSRERRTTLIRESSLVSPLTVLLFCQGQIETRNYRRNEVDTKDVMLTFQAKKNVRLICDPETAESLLNLRDSIHTLARYYIENQGLGYRDKNMTAIESYKQQLLDLLSKLLNEANTQTKYSEVVSSEAEDDWS